MPGSGNDGPGSSRLFGTWAKMLSDISSSGPNLASRPRPTENTLYTKFIHPNIYFIKCICEARLEKQSRIKV